MIAEHPQRNVPGTSRAPLQLVSRCHIPGDLCRQIYAACREDQKLLSPDTDVQNLSIHHRNTQRRGCAGQQSFLCPGRGPSRAAQPKGLLISVGNRHHGATRKSLAQPPLTASLFLTPTLSFSIVCKAPIAPAQPPSPHSSQRQILPRSHLPRQALPRPWAGSPAGGSTRAAGWPERAASSGEQS